jgi:probable rRNA maturation factor
MLSFSLRHPFYAPRRSSLRSLINRAVGAALAHEGIRAAELSVLLTHDAALQALNHDFRGKNKPTNVLSFPGEGEYLGDIAISLDTVAREAEGQDKSFESHLTHLAVHGTLHLLGLDHEKPSEARRMEAKEAIILQSLGVSDPYV